MTWQQTIIKHVLPAPLLETSTFSGVSLNSLKILLVLSHRRILRPSLQLAWRIREKKEKEKRLTGKMTQPLLGSEAHVVYGV